MICCQRIHVFPFTSSNVPNHQELHSFIRHLCVTIRSCSTAPEVTRMLEIRGKVVQWPGRFLRHQWQATLERDGITGIYFVLTYHTPRKFKPCFSDNMIQHGIVLDKAMHGIYATWVTQTYLRVCCLCYTSGAQILSPLVCINYLLYPYAHYIGSDLLHVHDRTFCYNLVSKHAGYFTLHVLKMFLKFEFGIKCVSPLPSLGWKLVTWGWFESM